MKPDFLSPLVDLLVLAVVGLAVASCYPQILTLKQRLLMLLCLLTAVALGIYSVEFLICFKHPATVSN